MENLREIPQEADKSPKNKILLNKTGAFSPFFIMISSIITSIFTMSMCFLYTTWCTATSTTAVTSVA